MEHTIAATGLSSMIGAYISEASPEYKWERVQVDLRDNSQVEAAIAHLSADIVINFAAFTDVNAAWNEKGNKEGDCYRLNVNGLHYLKEACHKHGKFLIQISTDYVFEGNDDVIHYETDKADADSDWYGYTKRLAEEDLQQDMRHTAIVRIGSPFQSHSDRKEDIVRKIVRQETEQSLPKMFSNTIITPTYVEELKLTLDSIIYSRSTGIFHAVGSSSISPHELAVMVRKVYEIDIPLPEPGKLEDYLKNSGRPYPRYLRLSNNETKKRLGVNFMSIEAALANLRNKQADRAL